MVVHHYPGAGSLPLLNGFAACHSQNAELQWDPSMTNLIQMQIMEPFGHRAWQSNGSGIAVEFDINQTENCYIAFVCACEYVCRIN